MRRLALAALVVPLTLGTSSVPAASARPTSDVIVTLGGPATPGAIEELRAEHGPFEVRAAWHIIPAFAARIDAERAEALARDPRVRQVEPDAPVRAAGTAYKTWYGSSKATTDFGVTGDMDGALRTYTRSDVVACVIDTGIDAVHADLDQGKVIGWRDLVGGRAGPYDDNGHGSHVAGILAGQGDGSSTYRGVAYGAALVGVKALNSSGSGSTSTIISAVQFCTQNKAAYNIRLINLSLGSSSSSDGTDALSRAVDAAADAGILPVVAAGNAGPARATIGSPAAAAKALTVCSIADPGAKGFFVSAFSSRGPTLDGRIKPDVCGPGHSISSVRAGSGTGYTTLSGTSMATPFVAAVAALMLDAKRTLTPADLKSIMMSTAQDWAAPGADTETGTGRVQAYEAIKRAGSWSGSGPAVPSHFAASGSIRTARAKDRFELTLSSGSYPIGLTLIIPGASSAKDFDLRLMAYDGSAWTTVALANGSTRQETIGVSPGTRRTFAVEVSSYAGTGTYTLDLSYGGPAPRTTVDG